MQPSAGAPPAGQPYGYPGYGSPAQAGAVPGQRQYVTPQGGPRPPQVAGAMPPQMAGARPQGQAGYPGFAPTQAGYPPTQQGGYPPPQQGGYPGQQGGYPQPQGGYHAQGGYPPSQPGYPPQGQAGYPPTSPGQSYPPGAPPGQGYPPGAQHPTAPPPGQNYPPGVPPPGHPGPGGWDPSKSEKMPIPGDDEEDGPVADAPEEGEAPKPSAPPVDGMDSIHGYNQLGFNGMSAPPPSYEAVMDGPQPAREPLKNLPKVSTDQARESLLQFVSEQCCWGKGPAQNLQFMKVNLICAFHYTLETFTEMRATAWHYEPYVGTPIDGPQNGRAPGPWEIQCTPPQKFQDQVLHYEVPHTASVKPCHHCLCNGQIWCTTCSGQGRTRCSSCHGRGYRRTRRDGRWESRRCFSCHGHGTKVCKTCTGSGRIVCPTCQGKTQLKCYIRLTTTWKNNVEDHIVERTDLPDHLIRNVTGEVAFEEEGQGVWPINHFPDDAINKASHEIVTKHRTAFVSQRTLMQRHKVRIVPVNELHTKYKDKEFTYFVYGYENKVHAPDYPAQCCWGCSIL